MTRSGFLLTASFLMILHTARSQSGSGSFFASRTTMSGQDSACMLLEDALELMQKSPVSKLSITWDSLKAAARLQLISASSSKDAHPVINWCAAQAQLNHSFLMPKANVAVYTKDTATLKRTPSLREIVGRIQSGMAADGIGYLSVPRISTTDAATCSMLADSLQQLIRQLAGAGATNWIIDLRNNTGGNCWPMIAGLGPLLGEGVCGYFVRPERRTSIRYERGAAWHSGILMCNVPSPFILPDDKKKNIVILTGPNTSSAGEILALAFRGLKQIRFMGEETAGLTTGNTTYTMMDGSMLVLSVCREADRKGIVLEGKLQPDDRVTSSRSEDTVKSEAVMWLQSM